MYFLAILVLLNDAFVSINHHWFFRLSMLWLRPEDRPAYFVDEIVEWFFLECISQKPVFVLLVEFVELLLDGAVDLVHLEQHFLLFSGLFRQTVAGLFEVVCDFIQVFAENFLFLALTKWKVGIRPQFLFERIFINLLLLVICLNRQVLPVLTLVVVKDTIEFVLDSGVDLWILLKNEIGLLGLH